MSRALSGLVIAVLVMLPVACLRLRIHGRTRIIGTTPRPSRSVSAEQRSGQAPA